MVQRTCALDFPSFFTLRKQLKKQWFACYIYLMGRFILNLTQHKSTPEQVAQGVKDLSDGDREVLSGILTFDEIPSKADIRERARKIATMASWSVISDGEVAAMIGGAPYLMGPLEEELRKQGITPVYAFSKRESEDQIQPDGTVRKVTVFRHVGFVEA